MYKMNAKIMAAVAVFAMVIAGFGVMAAAEDNDAATGDIALVFVDKYIAEDDAVLAEIGVPVYVTTLADDFEDRITILNKEYFDAMKEAGLIKGMTVTFTAEQFAEDDIAQGIAIFTNAEINKLGEIIGGVDTKVVFETGAEKTAVYEVVFADDAEAAIVIAVAAAIAETEAEYADYLSPEEVQALIDEVTGDLYTKEELDAAVNKAVQATKDFYKDYKSPAQVEKAINDAIDEYKATHPGKDDTFLYVTIVLAAIIIALGGFLAYDKVIKPKMAKKVGEQVL